MSATYKFDNPDGIYFISTATIQWVDVLSLLTKSWTTSTITLC